MSGVMRARWLIPCQRGVDPLEFVGSSKGPVESEPALLALSAPVIFVTHGAALWAGSVGLFGLVGRPGLDPGTLGSKVTGIRSIKFYAVHAGSSDRVGWLGSHTEFHRIREVQ